MLLTEAKTGFTRSEITLNRGYIATSWLKPNIAFFTEPRIGPAGFFCFPKLHKKRYQLRFREALTADMTQIGPSA